MPTQRIVVAKLSGMAGDAALETFRRWNRARLVDSPNEWAPDQWPDALLREADAWADQLRQHGHLPPVTFFAEFVDLWAGCKPWETLGAEEFGLLQMCGQRWELFCIASPLCAPATKRLRRDARRGQFDENKIFGWLTLAADRAWAALIERGAIVFLRLVLGAMVEDHEMAASQKSVPDWMSQFDSP